MTKDTVVVGYGVHYRANNQLIKSVHARIMLQVLLDQVRRQLEKSLSNTTIMMDKTKLSRIAGLDKDHTGPGSLRALEQLGLVKLFNNAVTVNCDEYVTTMLSYEKMTEKERAAFAKEFKKHGIEALKIFNIEVKAGCRQKLVDMKGSSITEDFQSPKITAENLQLSHKTTEDFQSKRMLNREIAEDFQLKRVPNHEIAENFQSEEKTTENFQSPTKTTENFQLSYERVSESLKIFSRNCNSSVLESVLSTENLQSSEFDEIKSAFLTGELTESCFSDPAFDCKFSVVATEIFQSIGEKQLKIFSTVINNNINNKYNEGKSEAFSHIGGETFSTSEKSIFEGWGKVEPIELVESSADPYEGQEPSGALDEEEMRRRRASRKSRERNPYRDKPFIRKEKVGEMVDYLPETIDSPVRFFIYHFVWGLYELYCEHYHPSRKYDEMGDEIDEPQDYNWREMSNALIPQDEVCSLAMNVYEDLRGVVEQGRYELHDISGTTTVCKLAFDSMEDFNPVQVFQWEPCLMRDKETPAFKIVFDRFYDICAEDATAVTRVATRDEKRRLVAQDRAMTEAVLRSDPSQLSPMERAIKDFYADFVVMGEDCQVDLYLDGNGEPMEGTGRLPDFKIKPWCIRRKVNYDEFTGVFAVPYKPCDGLSRRAYIFSAEKTARWNDMNGFKGTVAHEALEAKPED